MQLALMAMLRFAAIIGPRAALQSWNIPHWDRVPYVCLTLPSLQTVKFATARKERSIKVESNQLAHPSKILLHVLRPVLPALAGRIPWGITCLNAPAAETWGLSFTAPLVKGRVASPHRASHVSKGSMFLPLECLSMKTTRSKDARRGISARATQASPGIFVSPEHFAHQVHLNHSRARQVHTNLIPGRPLAFYARAASIRTKSARPHAKTAVKDTFALQVLLKKPCARRERGAVLVWAYPLLSAAVTTP